MLKNSKIMIRVVAAFIVGALLLSALSFIQKTVMGFDPYKLRGYIIPFIFGGTSGSVIGFYIFKVYDLNIQLAKRVNELEQILPVCSHCKKIRKADANPRDQESWELLEEYVSHYTSSSVSHGICPECMEKHYKQVKKS